MKRLVVIALAFALCTSCFLSSAFAHRKSRRSMTAAKPAPAEETAAPRPGTGAPDPAVKQRADSEASNVEATDDVECDPDDMRCKVDQRLDFIENKTREVYKGYQDRSVWKSSAEYEQPSPGKTKYGTKALKYALDFPSYILKAITWPAAIGANQLIKHGIVRKVVDVVSNDERTFWVYPLIEFGFGSGFGGGVGIKHYDLFHRNFKLDASYTIHINMNQDAFLALGKPNVAYIGGKPLAFRFINKWKHRNQDDFYGIGPTTTKPSGKYGMDEFNTGGWFGYEVIEHLLLRMHLHYIWDDSESGSGGEPVTTRFPASELTGYAQSLHYLDVGLGLVHDTRDAKGAPSRGGFQKLTFSGFVGLGANDLDYNEFEAEVVQFFNVWRPRHVIVLRTDWVYQQQMEDGIPFYRLARLDVDSPNRSYNYGRYRDRARYVFNVEYRFPVWDYLDGQLFWDFGRVFHDWSDISLKHLKHSVGAGLRLTTKDFFLMRFQIAGGSDGVKFLLKTSQAF